MRIVLKKNKNADWLLFSIFLALVYQAIWPYVLPPIPLFPLLPYLFMDFFFLLYFTGHRFCRFPSEIIFIGLFSVYCVVIGFIISANKSLFLDNIFWAIEYLVLVVSVFMLCVNEKKMDSFVVFTWFLSLVYLLVSSFRGITVSGRLSLSYDSNPNSLGIMCYFSVFSTVYLCGKTKHKGLSYLVVLGIFIFAVLTCMKTGSKKGIIAMVAFVAVFFLPYLSRLMIKNIVKLVFWGLFLFCLYYIFRVQIQAVWKESIVYQRFIASSGVDVERNMLIQDAIRVFKEHPILGVGYQNYYLFSSTNMYSHSTYAETLACTGIIGSFLWFWPYIVLIIRFIKLHLFDDVLFRFLISLFVVQLFFDTVMVTYYDPLHYMMYAIIIAGVNCYSGEIKNGGDYYTGIQQ